MLDIQLRDVPEHLVVVEDRTVGQAEVFDYLVGAMARVHRRAEEHGGSAGTSAWPYLRRQDRTDEPVFFVVYHGNPNDSPTLVEVCAPVLSGGSEVVRQPTHREAFVRLRKSQVGPEIGKAYEAVEGWIIEQGLDVVGPPREVFFTDFQSAADEDEVFDVAFPVPWPTT